MKNKTKLYLKIVGIAFLAVVVLLAVIYLMYGWNTTWMVGVAIVIGVGILGAVVQEIKHPRPKTDRDRLRQIAEEERARESGRIRAQEDYQRFQRQKEEDRKAWKEINRIMRR